MKVLIVFDNLQGTSQEMTYFSKFGRINAKGIKEEAKNELIKRFGKHAKDYEIINLYRED